MLARRMSTTLSVDPPRAAIDGSLLAASGSRCSSVDRAYRRCPPGVVKVTILPATLHRRSVAGDTPSMALASLTPSQTSRSSA